MNTTYNNMIINIYSNKNTMDLTRYIDDVNDNYNISSLYILLDFYIKQGEYSIILHYCEYIFTYYSGITLSTRGNIISFEESKHPSESLEKMINIFEIYCYVKQSCQIFLKYGISLGYKNCLYLYLKKYNYYFIDNLYSIRYNFDYLIQNINNSLTIYGPTLHLIYMKIKYNTSMQKYIPKLNYYAILFVIHSNFDDDIDYIFLYNKFVYNTLIYKMINNNENRKLVWNITTYLYNFQHIRKDLIMLFTLNKLKQHIINYLYRPNGIKYKSASQTWLAKVQLLH